MKNIAICFIKKFITLTIIIVIMTLIGLIMCECFPNKKEVILIVTGFYISYINNLINKRIERNFNSFCPHRESNIENKNVDYCPKCGHKIN